MYHHDKLCNIICMPFYVTICSYFISCMCHLYLATSLLYVHALVFLAHIYVDIIVSVTNVFVVFLSNINKHFFSFCRLLPSITKELLLEPLHFMNLIYLHNNCISMGLPFCKVARYLLRVLYGMSQSLLIHLRHTV